jgi:serine/threonine-protein kinase HipA
MRDKEIQALSARQALVYVKDEAAGKLTMVATDEFSFAYNETYIQSQGTPISLRLPLRREPYISEYLHPFFDNLLFEGEQLRLAEKKFGLNRRSSVDRFKLLMLTGQFTLNAVSILPLINNEALQLESESQALERVRLYPLMPAYQGSCSICLKVNPQGEHKTCHKALWETDRPIQMEAFIEEPMNIFRTFIAGQSISGAQRKALFHLDKFKHLKRQGFPQYILKPDGDFPEMPANEHLTLSIAKELNFPVPPIGLYRVDEIGLVCVVKRFDWTKKTGYQPIEDMAQLNEEQAERKDQGTLEAIGRTIETYTQSPAIEHADFFRRILFAFVTGNGEIHLKNWSIYRDAKSGFLKLAPLYDYLNVRASFPQEQVESVLPLNGKQKNITRVDFEAFAKTIGVKPGFVQSCFSSLPHWHAVIQNFLVRSALSEKIKVRYDDIVKQRLQALQ